MVASDQSKPLNTEEQYNSLLLQSLSLFRDRSRSALSRPRLAASDISRSRGNCLGKTRHACTICQTSAREDKYCFPGLVMVGNSDLISTVSQTFQPVKIKSSTTSKDKNQAGRPDCASRGPRCQSAALRRIEPAKSCRASWDNLADRLLDSGRVHEG